jgi:hypothetical protein
MAEDPSSGVTCPITAPAYACFSVPSASFGAYEAGLSFNVDTVTSLISSFAGGQVTVSQVTMASATGIVEFDYTIPTSGTPEPTTLALMGGVLLGLGLIGKRFKKA